MRKLSLNQDWVVRPLSREGEPKRVNVPHDAMIDEPRLPSSQGGDNIGWYVGGDYEYTKILTVPAEWEGLKAVIEFEGVYHDAEVYINGEKAGFRPCGYTGFCIDADKYLKYGADNALKVIARNADQPNSRWYTGTGIYRPVNLWLGGESHIRLNGVRIRTLNHLTGEIEVLVRASKPGEIRVEILDGDEVVASRRHISSKRSVLFRFSVPDPRPWDVDTPNLYRCRVIFGDDVVEETFGIRTLNWSPAEGLTLNGRRVILRGACIHHDNGFLGACAFPEAEARKVRLLKESGYNALRSAHNPCSRAMLDACDRLGMLMLDEYADAWTLHKTPHDCAAYVKEWWRQDLKAMVDKDFNHPCVIMYSTGNGVSETATPEGVRLAGDMTRYLHELDDSRPVTCGINPYLNLMSAIGRRFHAAAKPSRNRRRGGLPGCLSRKMGMHFMKLCAALPAADAKARDAYAGMDIAGYNYGILRYKKDLKKYPDRLILGTESLCKDAWRFWDMARDNPRIIGDFVSSGIDYIGGSTWPAPEYGDYSMTAEETRMTGGNGRLDITGKPRAEAAYTRVALGQQAAPSIGVMPVNRPDKPCLTGWHLTRAIESWSFNGCEGKPARVEVYARAAEVELKLNGVSLGRKKVGRTCCTRFRTAYQPGILTAVAYDSMGTTLGECTLTSASDETELRLLPEHETVGPGALSCVRIRFTDEHGIWKPMERHTVHAFAENAELVGLGCANAYVVGNYNGESTDTYYGEALAILRAGADGKAVLNVTSDDGRTACAAIPVENTDDSMADVTEHEDDPQEEVRIVIPITLSTKE